MKTQFQILGIILMLGLFGTVELKGQNSDSTGLSETIPDFTPLQTYLSPPPYGMNALFARHFIGGRGELKLSLWIPG
ncbi:MAG: hypothetical protein D6681_22460 [Calditrichaeota bacterium]|nr:MAG: hypothetical protein D6681_22460 [Calditrichota bacterium]